MDVAALFAAAILRRNPDSIVIPFDTSAYEAVVDPGDTVLSLAERLARPADLDVDGLLVIDEARPAAPVAGLDLRWATVTLDGKRGFVEAVRPGEGPRTDAFVASLDVTSSLTVVASDDDLVREQSRGLRIGSSQ